ncbi:MAG: hypothetical protein ACTSPU_11190 [Promethearchaeota archaeon]
MTDHNFDNFSHYFNKWQKNIINFTLKRNLVNKELEIYIKSFQTIDSEIYKALFTAKEYYNKKHRYYNQKIKRLKQKEIEFKQLLDYVNREKRSLTEPKVKDEISSSIRYIKLSINEIEDKINDLSNQIEELNLDVDEEDNIIEDIKNLDKDKKINLRHLRKLEQDLLREMQHNSYFKTVRTIEILEINSKIIIPRNLNKWSKKRVKIHRKMLDLCRKAKVFENIKKQIENELLGIKKIIDRCLRLYSAKTGQNKNKLIEEQLRFFKKKAKAKAKAKAKEKRIINTKYIIKKKRLEKKFKNKKLEIALEKQKSGKKLDFYEFKLILDSKKKE